MNDAPDGRPGLPAGLTTDIAAIAAVMAEHGLEKVNVEANGIRVTLSAPRAPRAGDLVAPVIVADSTAGSPDGADGARAGYVIPSPMIGTFYTAPGPGELPFVRVGDLVSPGQTIGIIEAMKIMNEIQADRGGIVEEILVSNGQPVEYNQPLMRLGQ